MKEHPRPIQAVKFERDWRKGKSMVNLKKIAQTGLAQTDSKITDFKKVYFIFAFHPITLKLSKHTNV